DLLDLARLSQSSFAAARDEVDLSELALEAVERYEPQAREYGVELRLDADDTAPALADEDRVVQVLSNLIENAVRCTPAGGSVVVTARRGELTVADTGPGLAP